MIEKSYKAASQGKQGRGRVERKKRELKLAQHEIWSSPPHGNTPEPPSYQIRIDTSSRPFNLDYYDFRGSSPGMLDPNVDAAGQIQHHSPWDSNFPDEQLFHSLSPNFPDFSINGDEQSCHSAFQSWDMLDPKQELLSDSNFESFGFDIDSMDLSSPNTASSTSTTNSFDFTSIDPSFDPLDDTGLQDLVLPTQYYEDPRPPPFPNDSPFHNDYQILNTSYGDISTTHANSPLMPRQQDLIPQSRDLVLRSQNPWNSQDAQISRFRENANPGCVAFEPSRGLPYDVFTRRENLLTTSHYTTGYLEPEQAVSAWGSDASYANSHYTSSAQGSPQHTPGSTDSPSPQDHNDLEYHSHVFSAFPGPPKQKATRGRIRPLTTKEKQEARNVRQVGACWACHLSKTKCSPCSPGSPCEQCTRLSGKRRFCLLSCFNDPIETLEPFLTADYLTKQITRANVEKFIENGASGWGHKHLHIKLTWNYRMPSIEANVVALTMSSASSKIGIQYTTKAFRIVKLKSPPLAIPLAGLASMKTTYSKYVEDIVRNDLDQYASIAYDYEGCEFEEELLKVISRFYTNYQCDLLRQALEIHVACRILGNSLFLDEESRDLVQNHFGEELSEQVGPTCAEKQIHLALFIAQRERIRKVLKEWGQLMWTSNKNINSERKWATSLSVFLILCLVMDKTLYAVSLLCSHKTEIDGNDAHSEKSEYRRMVRLTETELFERCKEILHSNFKSRKAGKESFNPIRDGEGKVVDGNIVTFVRDLRTFIRAFEGEVRSHKTCEPEETTETEAPVPYLDWGRLACIFLDGFLEH